jgi:hypothetical protein
MATKKAGKRAPTTAAFIFKKEWIFDPVPWLKLNREAITRINQLKTDFAKKANEIIKQGQR